MLLQPARLIVQPLERAEFFFAPELRAPDRGFQDTDRLVIDLERHRERMPVLAAVRKREPRRIA